MTQKPADAVSEKREVPSQKRSEFWAQIDARCVPSAAASADDMRPALQHGFIHHEACGQSWLYVTDSYVAARIPITFPATSKKRTIAQREALLPSKRALTPAALKALDKSQSGRFRIEDGGKILRAEGPDVLYPLASPEKIKATDLPKIFRQVMAEEPKALRRAAFSPKLLNNLGRALGSHKGSSQGVRLRFIDPLRPIRVEPLTPTGAEGLLMQIRDPQQVAS